MTILSRFRKVHYNPEGDTLSIWPPGGHNGPNPREVNMLKLYHHHTSVCAAKTRLVLAEKNLEF
jgi:hypothetical protein